ncbi:hypothetical protein FRC04_010054, partial [Tulasnella sp. 424]
WILSSSPAFEYDRSSGNSRLTGEPLVRTSNLLPAAPPSAPPSVMTEADVQAYLWVPL